MGYRAEGRGKILLPEAPGIGLSHSHGVGTQEWREEAGLNLVGKEPFCDIRETDQSMFSWGVCPAFSGLQAA